ncbi:unnamed protein product [Caenorhabditis brenneri]
MSLSRPIKFPLLKLPWLCIEAVVKCWNVFDIIFFALISTKTRRIVKSFKIPLNGIEVYLTSYKNIRLVSSEKDRIWIELERLIYKTWYFRNLNESFFENYTDSSKYYLLLLKNAVPLYTSRTNDALTSDTHGNLSNVLIMALEFLIEVFKCSVERVDINGDNLPESGDIGVKSTVNLYINQNSTQPYGYAQSQKLNLLLENLKVTGTCTFGPNSTERGFYCDAKFFICRDLVFGKRSAAWVTREILLQFEVPRLNFYDCPFSVRDILSFITNWFHSDNKKLENLYIEFGSRQISLDKFQTKELNPVPFSGRNRFPQLDSFRYMHVDFSKGLEIVRHDGLVATIHVNDEKFLFHIWHNQSSNTQS